MVCFKEVLKPEMIYPGVQFTQHLLGVICCLKEPGVRKVWSNNKVGGVASGKTLPGAQFQIPMLDIHKLCCPGNQPLRVSVSSFIHSKIMAASQTVLYYLMRLHM